MSNKYVMIFFAFVVCALLFLVMSVRSQQKEHEAFIEGYKMAYMDYVAGSIDCVVKVKFPKWIEESNGRNNLSK